MEKRTSSLARLTHGLVVALLAVATLGCPSDKVEIGAVVPQTGAYASYGVAVKQGIELALAEIAADPDYPIELTVRFADTGSDPAKAAALLAEMYDDGLPLVIGGIVSGEAIEMTNTVLNRYDRVLVSPTASSPDLTGASPNFFRIYPSDFLEANKMALFAQQTLKLDKIAIMAEEQTYATGIQTVFAQEFARLGGEVLEPQLYPPHTDDLSGIAEHIVTLDAPAVYVAGYDAGIAKAIRALKAAGYEGKILTTAAFATPNAIELAGDDAKGVLLTKVVFEVDSEFAHVRKFVDGYEQRFGEKPDLFAAHGYDATKLVAEAIKGRAMLTGEIVKGLRAIGDFPGVTGGIQFDERGDVKKFPRVYLVYRDLTLLDYDEHATKVREEFERRKRELQEKLRQIQQKAEDIGG